jgi:hypothetical protein
VFPFTAKQELASNSPQVVTNIFDESLLLNQSVQFFLIHFTGLAAFPANAL